MKVLSNQRGWSFREGQAQQGMPWQVMLKMFGHSDFELILKVYYAQNDDERLVAEASKIDFGLGLPKVG